MRLLLVLPCLLCPISLATPLDARQDAGVPGTPTARTSPPVALPVPPGWRTERFSLPPEFAPSMTVRGEADLRFPPGMFKPDAPDFWTYAFVWELAPVPRGGLDTAALNAQLQLYFEGLARAVEPKGTFDRKPLSIRSALGPAVAPSGVKEKRVATDRWEGPVDSYDPFATHRPLRLHVRVERRDCGDRQPVSWLFLISPSAPGSETWSRFLEPLAQASACRG